MPDLALLDFPDEWKNGLDWYPGWPDILMSNPDGRAFAAGGVLMDGTNLFGLAWPGGQRVMRSSPDTGWAVEERFTGWAPPSMVAAWRVLVDCMVESLRLTREENGGRMPRNDVGPRHRKGGEGRR